MVNYAKKIITIFVHFAIELVDLREGDYNHDKRPWDFRG